MQQSNGTNGRASERPPPSAKPIPSRPPEPVDQPRFRRLVTEIYEVDSGGREWVLETVDATDTDIIAYVKAKNEPANPMVPELMQWPMGAVAFSPAISEPVICGRCGGTKLDPEHQGECGECQDVVGTTPSGEAGPTAVPVTIRTPEEFEELYGRKPAPELFKPMKPLMLKVGTMASGEAVRMAGATLPVTWCRACQASVYTDSSAVCGRCGGVQTEAADEATAKEEPVRMVGAERAEASSLSDRRWSKEAEFFASVGKLPSERIAELHRENEGMQVEPGSLAERCGWQVALLAMFLDERLGRGGT